MWISNPPAQTGCSTFLMLTSSLTVFRSWIFSILPQKSAACSVSAHLLYELANWLCPQSESLSSRHPLTAKTAPAFFCRAAVSIGGVGVRIHLSAAADFSIQGLEGDRVQNSDHFSFIYAASLTVEIVSRSQRQSQTPGQVAGMRKRLLLTGGNLEQGKA